MLERIAEIQGVGLLHQSNGKPFTCQRGTLIYADNGRGKSTLAAVFRSVSTGNTSLVSSSKTIDGTLPPKVALQFGSGHKVMFSNGVWSEQRPELLVFDADFVGRNVHSGGAVNTDHRKNLLEFALGEAAVAARAAVDSATAASKTASDQVGSLVSQLSGHHQGMLLSQFEKLQQIADIDPKLAGLQRRLVAAGNVAVIQAKQVPSAVAEPSFDLDALFAGFALSLKDVHADAEKIVKQHVAKLGGKEAESWLSQGRQFDDGVSCPFCAQDITGNDLLHAYQTHFNAAYVGLKTKIAVLRQTLETGAAESIVDGFAKGVGIAAAHAAAWAEHVTVHPIAFDATAAAAALATFREFLSALTMQKQAAPAEAVGDAADKAKALSLWADVVSPMHEANAAIKTTEGLIGTYKAQLNSDSVVLLQQQIRQLQATKHRYDAVVVSLLAQLTTARATADSADKAKKTARENLDSQMSKTLGKYQTSINSLLKQFGASFSIKGMTANFRGNAPRSEFGLSLRGKDVALEGPPPSFATALSEGDKRTLAFAFFIASTLEDPKLASRVVVIDDPMCSLDLNRRHHTRTVLKKIYSKAEQLLVLAHDPFFLRDLRDTLRKDDKTAPIAVFQLSAAPGNYTDFSALDIDKECESVYARHHRLLNEFSCANGADTATVAKAVRPMLEGYLHRRFPGLLPKDLMFGGVVVHIRDAVATSPLSHAANLVEELNEINEYAGQFHHDTNPDADAVVISASELKVFVDRALSVVHKGAPP